MTNTPTLLTPDLDLYINAVMGRKVMDLVVLDVRNLTAFSDIFIICSSRSNRQVLAIAEYIEVSLKKHSIKPLSVEGKKEGHWILLDYGHIIIHVFYEPVRAFYDLEGLWIDAKRIETKRFLKDPAIS